MTERPQEETTKKGIEPPVRPEYEPEPPQSTPTPKNNKQD